MHDTWVAWLILLKWENIFIESTILQLYPDIFCSNTLYCIRFHMQKKSYHHNCQTQTDWCSLMKSRINMQTFVRIPNECIGPVFRYINMGMVIYTTCDERKSNNLSYTSGACQFVFQNWYSIHIFTSFWQTMGALACVSIQHNWEYTLACFQ